MDVPKSNSCASPEICLCSEFRIKARTKTERRRETYGGELVIKELASSFVGQSNRGNHIWNFGACNVCHVEQKP